MIFNLKRMCLAVMMATCSLAMYADSDVTAEQRDQNTPSGWTAVSLPSIPEITASNTFNITSYGASTSSEDNATAINAAISAANSAGGGMVVIPAGTWMVANPLDMKSNVVLHLSANCTLKMQPKGTYPAGKDNYLISNRTESSTSNIIIEGEGETSVIDGNGADWWPNYKSSEAADIRPGSIIRIKKGSNHLYRNFKITMAPQTNLTIGQSGNVNNVTVHDIIIKNPAAESDLATADGYSTISHNTDGMPVWANHVNIYNCDINTGDDNIVCDDGAHYVHAWNIKCGRGHGMSVGSNTKRVHDIIYENITFNGTTSGFRIKSDATKSGNDQSGTSTYGAVKNIICRNATMTGVRNPIKITSWYDTDAEDASTVSTPSTITETTPEFCNILFQNITADATSTTSWKHGAPVYIYGRPELKIHDVTLDNVTVKSKVKMYLAYCENVTFKNKCNIQTNSATTSPYTYEASYSGNYNGTANATYDDAGTSPVYFNVGDYTYYTTTVLNGQTVSKPSTDPTDGTKTFKGWAATEGSTTTVTFPYTVNAAMTFYAVWEGESGESGGGGSTGTNISLRFTSADGDITSSATYCNSFSVVGASGKAINIASSSKTIDGVSFTYCAKMGGTGSSDGRYISFPVTGDCSIKVYGGTSKSGTSRSLTIASGSSALGTSLKTDFCTSSSDPVAETYNYTGSATTIYIYSTNSGYNVYGIDVTYSSSGGGSSDPETPSGSTVTGTETTPTQKESNVDAVGLCYTIPATYVGGQGNSSKAVKFNLRSDVIEINVNPNYTITGFTFTGNDNYTTNGITISSVTVDGGSTNVLGSSTTFGTDKSENSFTVSNISATSKITLTASTPHDNQLNGTIVFTYKYAVQPIALQSTAKTSGRNGSVTLKFNNPMVASTATATLNGKSLPADVEGTTVKFIYTGLDYGLSYTFSLPANSLKDEFNQSYSEAVSLTITTDARATVTKKAFDKVVSNGDELAAAITEANNRSDKTSRYRIFIKKGAHVLPTSGTTTGGDNNTYPDPRTHLSGANVSFIGEDYTTTSFTNITPDATWDNGYGTACPLEGIGKGDVLIIDKTATESYFQGIKITTSMGDAHGRDIAVNDQSNKTIMKDVCLWGYQDTYVSNNSNGRFYFDGGILRGRTDYLCGKGDVYYNKVTLQQCGTGGYLAVPSVPTKYGYIFNECYIKKETSDVTYYFGRPWGSGTPIALFINTKVDAAPIAAGWAEMSNGWPDRFAEYNTKTTSGSSVSTSGRKKTYASTHTCDPVLTQAEAEYYSNMARIMGGSDGWDPTEYTEQCAKPTAELSGSTLSWTADAYASSWIVFKDGEYYANPTANSLALTESGSYTVRAANMMGGLGEASSAVEYGNVPTEPTAENFSMTTPSTAPSSISGMTVSGGSISDKNSTNKALTFSSDGVKFGGSACQLQVTLNSAIKVGTKVSVTYKNTSSDKTTGLGLFDSNVQNAVISHANNIASGASGTAVYVFKATDETYVGQNTFVITRNGGSGGLAVSAITVTIDMPESITATVASNRTFGSFSSIYNVDFSDGEGTDAVEAYTVKYSEGSNAVMLTRYKDVLPAGTGVVLYAGSDTKSQVLSTVATTNATVADNDMVGVPVATAVAASVDKGGTTYYNYGLSGDKFHPIDAGTIPAGKAYMSITREPGSTTSSKTIALCFGDVATDINTTATEAGFLGDGRIYNLQGVEVSKPQHGRVYIVNGKKLIVR